MSLNISPLEACRVYDPRLDFESKRFYLSLEGGASVLPMVFPASGNANQNSSTFVCTPPSPGVAVDRRVMMKMPVTIVFKYTKGAGTPPTCAIKGEKDAFRAFPLAYVINTISAQLNGANVPLNVHDVFPIISRCNNNENMSEGVFSQTPTALDQSQNYSDLAGTIRNPLNKYGDGIQFAQSGRGGFAIDSITNATAGQVTTTTLNATICEPLFLSPFYFGNGEKNAFLGVQQLNFTVNYIAQLERIWSHDATSVPDADTFATPQVTLGKPEMLVTFITPKSLQAKPSTLVYPYYAIDRWITESGSNVNAGATTSLSSGNIILGSIPKRMYLAIKKTDGEMTYSDTDTFFSIEKLNVTWNGEAGMFSASDKRQLYEISRANGVNLSWSSWSGEPITNFVAPSVAGNDCPTFNGVGSVFVAEFGKDIGLKDGEAPGLLGQYMLNLNVTVTNRKGVAVRPALYVVIVQEGTCTIENNSTYLSKGVLSKADILDAGTKPYVKYSDVMDSYGGSWFSKFKEGFSRALPLIKDVASAVKPVLAKSDNQYARNASKVMNAVGLGKRSGAGMTGGKLLSRKQLRDQLDEE
jgi:hypothetical protein